MEQFGTRESYYEEMNSVLKKHTQHMVLNGSIFTQREVPQGFVLSPVFLNVDIMLKVY